MLNRRARMGKGLVAFAAAVSLAAGSLFALAAPAPVGAQADTFSTASAVPANALLYGAVDLDMESAQWLQVEELLSRLGMPNALDELHSDMLDDADNDEMTEEELAAFLGGEAGFFLLPEGAESLFEQFEALNDEMAAMAEASPVAMDDLDVAELGEEFEITGVGAILEPSDVDLAWEVINQEIADEIASGDVQVVETTEGDVTILTVTPADDSDSEGGVVALAGDFIIIGGNVIDVQTVVDTANGDADSLADLDAFGAVAAELPAESLFFAYFDSSQVSDELGAEFLEGFYSLSPQLAASMEADYHGGIATWADDLGFRVDSVSMPAVGGDLSAMVPDGTVTFDQRVPAATSIFFGGIAPEGTWNAAALSVAQAVNAGMSGEEPQIQSFDDMFSEEAIQEQLDQAEQILGFDLLDDFFGQFQGEVAFALTFPNLMAMGSFSVDTVFVTELDDADTVAQSIEMLVRMGTSMAGDELPVTTREFGDDTIYDLGDQATTGIPVISVGVVGDLMVLGSNTGVDNFLMLDGIDSALSDDERYQEILAAFPGDDYYQIAYMDLTDIIPAVMGMTGMAGGMGAGASGISDADPACLEFSSQDEAQAAFDEDIFANSNLDQDFDGQACEDFFMTATPEATPVASGSLESLEAFGAVAYESDGNLYSSAILFVADSDE